MPTKSTNLRHEIATRGESLFETTIAAQVAARGVRDYVVIDIDSGDFEVAVDSITATRRLRERHPDARVWGRFVGSSTSLHFGGFQ